MINSVEKNQNHIQNGAKDIVSNECEFTTLVGIVASNQTIASRFITPISIMNSSFVFNHQSLMKIIGKFKKCKKKKMFLK